jgi:DNA-binding NarL/FixJ family response regulator
MGGLIAVGVTVDNEIFARGLEASLREDPAVMLVDPNLSGVVPVVVIVTPATLREQEAPPVVLVCSDEPQRTWPPCVAGVLPHRTLEPEVLLPAVHAAAAGLRIGMASAGPARLDTRSVEVLRLLAEGAGTREISDELGFSERTIKGVIAAIVADLGVRSRAQAVAVAMRNALI